jgi:hypothetical protein
VTCVLGTAFRRTKSVRSLTPHPYLVPSLRVQNKNNVSGDRVEDKREVTYVSKLHMSERVNVNGSVNNPGGEGLNG